MLLIDRRLLCEPLAQFKLVELGRALLNALCSAGRVSINIFDLNWLENFLVELTRLKLAFVLNLFKDAIFS